MKIYIGSDHNGFRHKPAIISYAKRRGFEVEDVGHETFDPGDDFPVFAARVANAVVANPESRGIVLCGSGQGVCIAANRFRGVRAGLGYDRESVRSSRSDDDINVLCLPASRLDVQAIEKLVDVFLDTEFDAAKRRIRRLRQLDELPH
jgi:ribose 5-phosphate isomerase B